VLDMAGNVLEWTRDWMSPLYYETSPEANPVGPASGTARVCRGGSFYNPTDGIRTVGRISLTPSKALETLGFRCVNLP
jgi:formylglycine-generating enzyme